MPTSLDPDISQPAVDDPLLGPHRGRTRIRTRRLADYTFAASSNPYFFLDPNLRVTQASVEVLAVAESAARVTQASIELLVPSPGPVGTIFTSLPPPRRARTRKRDYTWVQAPPPWLLAASPTVVLTGRLGTTLSRPGALHLGDPAIAAVPPGLKALAGSAAGTSFATAALSGFQKALAGSAAGTSFATAELSGIHKSLTGTTQTGGAATATLTVQRALSSTAAGVGHATVNLGFSRMLVGSTPGHATASATLTRVAARFLAGTASGHATTQLTLRGRKALQGHAVGQAGASGTLRRAVRRTSSDAGAGLDFQRGGIAVLVQSSDNASADDHQVGARTRP